MEDSDDYTIKPECANCPVLIRLLTDISVLDSDPPEVAWLDSRAARERSVGSVLRESHKVHDVFAIKGLQRFCKGFHGADEPVSITPAGHQPGYWAIRACLSPDLLRYQHQINTAPSQEFILFSDDVSTDQPQGNTDSL